MKRKIVMFLPMVIVLVSACVFGLMNKSDMSDEIEINNIQITVYDESETLLYDENKQTDKTILIDVLKELDDLSVETETGDYGEYITSIHGKAQENNYYWNYYINGEYASVGVSSCEIGDNDVYTFKLEKFE